ncbi:MAG: M55 family metallopeptidase [Gemmatimonadales bacterium]
MPALRSLICSSLLLTACGGAEPPAGDQTASADQPAGEWRQLTDPKPASGSMRVLVYHDMEGLSGQDDPATFRFSHRERYAVGRERLIADINAVVDGLIAGGATQVDVVDAHGSGNPDPDVTRAGLDPRANQVTRETPFRQYVDLVADDVYDAVVAVGMHAKTGSKGFASHTYTIGMDLILNGHSITESELVAFSWGRVGVPMIMVTGDDRLHADLATMPWIEYVETKRATAADQAELRPVDEVHAEMRAAAERAVKNRGQARVTTIATPVRAALRAVEPADLSLLDGVPGIQYHDQQVDFTAADFGAAYDGLIALIGVATKSYPRLLTETVRKRADGPATLLQFSDLLFQRWMDVESGRWTPPEPAKPEPGRRYHGAN